MLVRQRHRKRRKGRGFGRQQCVVASACHGVPGRVVRPLRVRVVTGCPCRGGIVTPLCCPEKLCGTGEIRFDTVADLRKTPPEIVHDGLDGVAGQLCQTVPRVGA